MKIPMQWIAAYADIPVSAEQYQHKMIMSGTGVEGLDRLGAEIENVVVGRIESLVAHPNSDHLLICQVNVGQETLQIVTGASNVFAGAVVPVAVHGAKLPGGVVIKRGKLRGEVSEGMLCSGTELGVPDSLYPGAGVDGILIFSEEYELGADVKPILGIDDTVVDFEILANRPDCLSVWGIARETAVALGTTFRKPDIEVKTKSGNISEYARVDVLDSALCPRYAARVAINVRIAPSPMWLRKYLHGAGMRSINNIVDITNFVMLETGHPMHAFDLDQVRGHHIIVRRANEGEILRTLDDKERVLTSDMLVIADEGGATGLAGIMGGLESEITDKTRTILFECAAFDRTQTRLTTRALGIRTESSGRFEKGVSAATVPEALARACQLVVELGAGDIVEGEIDLYPSPAKRRVIQTTCSRINARTGVEVAPERMAEILRSLHFDVTLDGDTLTAIVPEFRQDVEGYADLSEEVLRIHGFDALGSTKMRGETPQGGRSRRMLFIEPLKRLLAAWGGQEMMTFSFESPSAYTKLRLPEGDPRLSPIAVRNPLGEDTSIMRTSLAPAILRVMSSNISHSNDAGMLYEVAATFERGEQAPGELPDEWQILCIGCYGPDADFFALRDTVLELLRVQGIADVTIAPIAEPYHHPGRCATIYAGEYAVAKIGEVHPAVAESFDIERRVYLAEVDLDAVMALYTPMGHVKALPRFPAVTRDVALVMDGAQPIGPVLSAIWTACGPLLEEAQLFDVYRGERLQGKKSAAFSLKFRSADRTLTDEDVSKVFEKMLAACAEQFGAEIRK